MAKLEELTADAVVHGVVPNDVVTVVSAKWHGSNAIELFYKTSDGQTSSRLVYRHDEPDLQLVDEGRPWSFDGDGSLFRLVSEAHRIRLAHLFDPLLAIHTSLITPLPHQITAVYEAMLPRQPLRFLLADDPGAGKTIMAGLLIKELMIRGDVERCLVVAPGNLVEQWQDEMDRKFNLPFQIMTNDAIEAARTGNWFLENNLAIARLDKLSRNEDVQAKLTAPDCRYDLVIVDEAHKMSARFFGGEVKYTKRYHLGRRLSEITRHLLLMTATPHNGKEADFQLFMALLDGDRFEGKFRDGAHQVDVSDLMRRMVKEGLLKFDGRPLFPERIAHTVPFKLSAAEAQLYKAVTDYVREEFNRAEKLQHGGRGNAIGFALTILQRRLASSPAAVYASLRRRRERLEERLRELRLLQRGESAAKPAALDLRLSDEDIEDIEDAPEDEVLEVEQELLDRATAAGTIQELEAEIRTLRELEKLARKVTDSGEDTKWRELVALFETRLLGPQPAGGKVDEKKPPYGAGPIPPPEPSPHEKIVIFTEHRDTLSYLERRIGTLLGRPEAVRVIHGSMGREERRKAQEAFLFDPDVQVLLATDAAGEGINLQRAHLMINYDLPWNPNRIEQRFGRIHRIGQREVCHLWNLVAEETREGDVYRRLLDKLEEARNALGGRVFDVLGKLQFEGKSLRDLLLEAIRYGEQPEVKSRLERAVEHAVDQQHIRSLLSSSALAEESMDTTNVARVRQDMERADARRLQPHYIESFFVEAFARVGGTLREREPRRYAVKNVPARVRGRDRIIGRLAPILPRYERIVFEKALIAPDGKPPAAFVCPGHPLLDAVLDLTLETHRELLKRGTVLVDDNDPGAEARVMLYLEHSIQDARVTRSGRARVISQRMLYVELDRAGKARHLHYAPYLDYRPLADDEPAIGDLLALPECAWITRDVENKAIEHAIETLVPEHLSEVKARRGAWIEKTRGAVKDRLTKEIAYWDHRASELERQERAGKSPGRLNSQEARRRADDLQTRLSRRMEKLEDEKQIAAAAPVVLGGLVVIPAGLLARLAGAPAPNSQQARETQTSAARARAVVMEQERRLGHQPIDRETEKLGYDIESFDPETGRLRFIEVKGRISGADTLTVTRNEILYSLNKPDDYILAIVEFLDEERHNVYYVRRPFQREPDFGVTSVNYNFRELIERGEAPR